MWNYVGSLIRNMKKYVIKIDLAELFLCFLGISGLCDLIYLVSDKPCLVHENLCSTVSSISNEMEITN